MAGESRGNGDSQDLDEDADASAANERTELPSLKQRPDFYLASVVKVALFSVLGGWFYTYYWMYRSWSAYRAAWGYSQESFWRQVYEATGYRVSPFWRSLLASGYSFALFPAIQRECRLAGTAGVGVPILFAIAYNIVPMLDSGSNLALSAVTSPVWVLFRCSWP